MKTKTKFTVDYFIKKFSAIPRSKWGTVKLINDKGQHCALGLCGTTEDENGFYTFSPEAEALIKILGGTWASVVMINDNSRSKLKTPKGRILSALRKIKKESA